MGTFQAEFQVGRINGDAWCSVTALVDTGAVYSMLPASLLRDLEVVPTATQGFTFANGSRQMLGVGDARFKVGERERVSPVVFGPEGRFLFGATSLQSLGLIADTTHHQLVPAAELTL